MKAAVRWLALLLAASLTGCATSRSQREDGDFLRAFETAQTAWEQGTPDRAIEWYTTALARARFTDDALGEARTAYNLAVCLVATGRRAEAKPYLARARAILGETGRDAAQVFLVMARVAESEGEFGLAGQMAEAALKAKGGMANDVQARVRLAELGVLSNDARVAANYAAAFRRKIGKVTDPVVRAEAENVMLWLDQGEKRYAAAAAHADAAAAWLKRARRYRDMAETLSVAGDLWQMSGEHRKGGDRFLRAAASFMGAGASQRGLAALGSARAAAIEAGDRQLRARVETLAQAMEPH